MFYTYEHIRPDTGAIFYVGKGKGSRCTEKGKRNNYWKRIVRKAGGFEVRKLAEDIDEELAFLIECERISQLKELGVVLANMTDGGEGASGYRHTETYKVEQAVRMKKTMSIHKEALRLRQLGENNSAKKPGVGAKISVALKGRQLTESTKNKIAKANARGSNSKASKVMYDSKEFGCIKDFAEYLNVNYRTLVAKIRRVGRTTFTVEDYNSLTNGRVAF